MFIIALLKTRLGNDDRLSAGGEQRQQLPHDPLYPSFETIADNRFFAYFLTDRDPHLSWGEGVFGQNSQDKMGTLIAFAFLINLFKVLPTF